MVSALQERDPAILRAIRAGLADAVESIDEFEPSVFGNMIGLYELVDAMTEAAESRMVEYIKQKQEE